MQPRATGNKKAGGTLSKSQDPGGGGDEQSWELGRWHRGGAGQRVEEAGMFSTCRRHRGGYQNDLELTEGFNCQLRPL